MENQRIEREVHVAASPEVVFEVVSRPEHVREWWSDDAEFEPVAGATGVLVFGERGAPGSHVPALRVVEVDPPHRFAFRWTDDAVEPAEGNSLLVTFDLEAVPGGTLLRMVESDFTERGWDDVTVEAAYRDHVDGWDHFLPQIPTYVTGLVAAS